MQRIKRFGVWQTARVAGLLYLIGSALFCLPMAAMILLFNVSLKQGVSGVFMLVIPIFYGAVGFFSTALMCVLYNFIAGKFGGIEVEIE